MAAIGLRTLLRLQIPILSRPQFALHNIIQKKWMSDSGYDEGWFSRFWADYKWRTNRVEVMKRYYESESARKQIQYTNLQTVASLGQAEADLDDIFLGLCPNVKEYIGIEVHRDRCEEGRKILTTNHPSVKVTCHDIDFEEFQGKPESVDTFLLLHCLYSLTHKIPEVLHQALSLVKVGGKAIIAIHHGDVLRILGSDSTPGLVNLEDTIREAIKTLGFSCTEEKTEPFLIDLSQKGRGYFDFIQFGSAQMTKSERDIVLQRLSTMALPGTKKFPVDHTVFIISK